jgi:hypothetical protein
MNAQFQSQMAGQMEHAASIGAGMPMSDSIVGTGMNRAAAIGGPMAALGLGVIGRDPFSMAFNWGKAGARFGAGGAIAGGLAGAGIATGGAMAMGYAANQFFTGAQQQQQLGQMMSSSFRFANAYGGQGFGRGGTGEIGGMLRGMTTEQGPMGQMAGFEELGRLASNMGRMGMAQGVRDAKEFGDKFREMVKTVKNIAESMGTSLEEAQKMMGAMRSSGVFGQNQAASFAARIRQGAVAGGMATSELTGMMGVGSQISRMVGGRGRAGAAGGLETLTNIGVAQQMGLISEEDIYNTTGLTGAEGRRAMATRQMEQSAKFLQGSLGRRFLASVAGKDGNLDAASVAKIMSGDVGTDDTINMYNKNLNRIGRANFIRNEGKLRGAALEQFGGILPMLQMKQWLDKRGGIDVNENNDRAMIFMQRQLGMGNDESEMMLRQVRELPNILRQRKTSSEDDSYMNRIRERNSHTGLEGLKHKFDKAKAEVNATLQQVGADFYQSMTSEVDGFINRLTNTYVKETRRDVAGAFRTMMGGGAMGDTAAQQTFGIGNTFRSSNANMGLLRGGNSVMQTFAEGDAERFSKAGFGYSGSADGLMRHLGKVSQVIGASLSGGRGIQDFTEVQMAGAAGSDALRKALMGDMGATKGMDRLAAFGSFLSGQAGMEGLAKRFDKASDVERAQIMAAYSGKGGADVDQTGAFQDPSFRGNYGTTGMRTLGEGASSIGAAFGFKGRRSLASGVRGGDTDVGKYLLSEGGRNLVDRMMSDNEKVRNDARIQVEKEIGALRGKEDLTKEETARMRGLRGMLVSQKLTEMEVGGATPEQIKAEAGRLAKEHGISEVEVTSQASTIAGLAERNKEIARGEAGDRFGTRARENLVGLANASTGLLGKDGAISASRVSKVAGSTAGEAFLKTMVEQQQIMGQMGPGADNQGLMTQAQGAAARMNQNLGSMTVAEQRRLAEGLSMVSGAEDEASRVGLVASLSGTLEKGGKGLSGAASMLGVNMSKEELAKLMGAGGAAGAAKAIASKIGDGSLAKNADFLKDLESTLGSVSSGKFGEAGQKMSELLGNETVSKARVAASQEADPVHHLKGIAQNSKDTADRLSTAVGLLTDIKMGNKGDPEAQSE